MRHQMNFRPLNTLNPPFAYIVVRQALFPRPADGCLDGGVVDASYYTTTARLYYASEIPEINISAIAYFAASMFWRGSIHPWNEDGSTPVELGPFQEPFRQYLLGHDAFPKDCALCVAVREGSETDMWTYAPCGGAQLGKFHFYKFPMPGLAFSLVVSKNVPSMFREKCFVHAAGNPIVVTSLVEQYMIDNDFVLRRKGRRGSGRRTSRVS